MRHFVSIVAVVSLALLPAPGFGNSGPPPIPAWKAYLRSADKKDDKLPDAKMGRVIENAPVTLAFRHDLKRPQIVIPKKFGVVGVSAPAEEAAAPGARNLFAGLALSAALVTGGLWFVRRSGKAGKVMMVLFVVSAAMFVSPFLSDLASNEAAPPQLKGPPALDALKIDGSNAKLGMDIVIVAEGDRIQVILPKQLLPATMIPAEEFTKPPVRRFDAEDAPKKE
jgi:hypothetical protein